MVSRAHNMCKSGLDSIDCKSSFIYIKPVDDDVLDNGGVVCDASVTHFHVNDPEEGAQTLAVKTFS